MRGVGHYRRQKFLDRRAIAACKFKSNFNYIGTYRAPLLGKGPFLLLPILIKLLLPDANKYYQTDTIQCQEINRHIQVFIKQIHYAK